jgi:predicted transcriptional regulator
MPQKKLAPHPSIHSAQIRAARGLLNWSQRELAERAGVSKQSVTRIERGASDPRLSSVSALYNAIRLAGVEMIIDNNGIVGISTSLQTLLSLSA